MQLRQKGISLIELMVAAAISILVINAAVITFTSVKKAYSDVSATNETDVKALTVQLVFDKALSNNGFACPFGLENIVQGAATAGANMFVFYDDAVSVGDAVTGPQGITLSLAQANTNYLAIQKSNGYTTVASSNGKSITLAQEIVGLEADDYLVSCSSRSVELLSVDSIVNDTDVTLFKEPASPRFIGIGDFISSYELNIYYIRDTERNTPAGDKIYSLYVYTQTATNNVDIHELVEGVTNLQIYAVKTEDIVKEQEIAWGSPVDAVTKIDSSYNALRISFDVGDAVVSKIIPIGNSYDIQ